MLCASAPNFYKIWISVHKVCGLAKMDPTLAKAMVVTPPG